MNLTHRAIATNVWRREALLPTGEGERIVCIMPVSHSYGVAMGLFLAPNWHGTLVPLKKFVAEGVLETGRERAHHHLSRQPDRFRRPAQWTRVETRYRT